MAIQTLDGLIAALPNGTPVAIQATLPGLLINRSYDIKRAQSSGIGFSGATTPADRSAGGTIPVAGDAGYLAIPNPAGANKKYLAGMNWMSLYPMVMELYDEVWTASGFASTDTSVQSITGFPTLTRPGTSGEGLRLFLVNRQGVGGGTVTFTATYTNSGGQSGRTASLALSAMQTYVGWSVEMPLQTGDTGVQSIQSLQLSASMGAPGGDLLLVLARKLTSFSILANGSAFVRNEMDFIGTGFPELPTNVAVMARYFAQNSAVQTIYGELRPVEG